jgi:O-antigen ligase
MSGRKEIYANAREMARDYFPLGSGPGTFGSLYRLYRGDPGQRWEAYLHNDWLETWITFGGIGFALIALALVLTAARWAFAGGLEAGPVLTTFLWVAMGGALAHALYDFPFQIHSILFAFVLLACVSSIASRKP